MTTEDYVTHGLYQFLSGCHEEWKPNAAQRARARYALEPVALRLEAERRSIERRHAERRERSDR